MNNLRQLCLGMILYADTNKGAIPFDGGDGTTAVPVTQVSPPAGTVLNLTWDDPALWWNAAPDAVNLPTYDDLQRGVSVLEGAGGKGIFICPAASEGTPGSGDTVLNGFFMLHGAPPGGGGHGDEVRKTYVCYVINSKLNATQAAQKISQLRPASAVVLFTEKRMNPGELPATDANYSKALGQMKAEHKRFTARHRNGGFLGFADGHVGWFDNAELNTPFTTTPTTDFNNPDRVIWDPFGPAS